MKKITKKSEKEKLLAEIERLKKELKKRKKYGLVWEEKPEDVVEMCKEKLPVLKEVKNKEIITDRNKPVNLLIEGDNYHALSVLNYTHAKKVDVIYIDPPYNTGKKKEWKFNDHWVDKEDAYRHSKWLSFIEKRLKLAKNLLKDSGVIFISIDDNEVAQLKILMDHPDLLGENNLVGIFTWIRKRKPSHLDTHVRKNTEYVLCYAKNRKNLLSLKSSLAEDNKPYPFYNTGNARKIIKFPANYVKTPTLKDGSYNPQEFRDKKTRVKLLDKVEVRNGLIINNFRLEGEWRYSQNTLNDLIKQGAEIIIKGSKFKPYYIRKLKGTFDELKNAMTILGATGRLKREFSNGDLVEEELLIGTNEDAEEQLSQMDIKFKNPKPVSLIKFLVKISTRQLKDYLILDFFAGSGTTGHAVLELNKEDGGNRQFILCTNNENNICIDVCYPRIKKVIEGYKNLKDEKVEGLGGNLKYFKVDEKTFVGAEPTDRNKIKLTRQATKMLCVKEGTFEKIEDNKRFKIFKNSNHYAGIILDQAVIPAFKKAIKDIKGKFSVYIFSLGDETFDDEFKDVKQKVQLSPIPEAILRVYRRIFK
jgi:adenine-specific DNA-methyltransferase